MQQCSVNPGGHSKGATVNPRRYSQGNFAEPIASPAKKRPIFKVTGYASLSSFYL